MPPEPHDNYYMEVTQSINSVFELTARIDERVQSMMKKQEEVDQKIDNQLSLVNDLSGKVRVLESKNGTKLKDDIEELQEKLHDMQLHIQKLEDLTERQANNWGAIFAFTMNLGWVVVATYLLYRLGLQPSILP